MKTCSRLKKWSKFGWKDYWVHSLLMPKEMIAKFIVLLRMKTFQQAQKKLLQKGTVPWKFDIREYNCPKRYQEPDMSMCKPYEKVEGLLPTFTFCALLDIQLCLGGSGAGLQHRKPKLYALKGLFLKFLSLPLTLLLNESWTGLAGCHNCLDHDVNERDWWIVFINWKYIQIMKDMDVLDCESIEPDEVLTNWLMT